jgi:hypothetical protein
MVSGIKIWAAEMERGSMERPDEEESRWVLKDLLTRNNKPKHFGGQNVNI